MVLNLHYLFVILILLKAPDVWGFSLSRVEEYKKRAISLNLANEKQWIRLGHYHKSWTGNYESKIRGSFFLADDGAKNPEAELIKSIELFFSEPSNGQESIQCRYLFRRRWLIEKLHVDPKDIVYCEKQELWKKEFAVSRATLIFAAADLGNAASSFGHTFLKLSSDKNLGGKELLDYGVNYSANTASSQDLFYSLKGLTGFYSGAFTMLPYHHKIREYTNLEGRNIWEYDLNLTTEEVDKLVDHLLEIEKSWIPYYFLTDNCSYQLLSLFEVVRPEYELSERMSYFVAPIDTVKIIKNNTTLIKARRFRKSLKNDFNEDYAKLSYRQRLAVKGAVESHQIDKKYELSAKEEAEVYEVGMKYFAIKGYNSEKDFEDEKYKLSLKRAQLGMLTSERQAQFEYPPDESHDSSGLYWGGGREASQDYTNLKFRHVYHDLISDDSGAVPFSHNEIMSFDMRYYFDSRRTELAKWTILNLLSSDAVTYLQIPLTWKVNVGTESQFHLYAEAGGGLSIDLPFWLRTRSMILLSGRARHIDEARYFAGVGPELILVSRLNNKMSAEFSVQYFAVDKREPYLDIGLMSSYQFDRNLELQLEYHQKDHDNDYKLMLLKQFIL